MNKDDQEQFRNQFTGAPLYARLDHIATTLARISSPARHAADAEPIIHLLEQVSLFIEWTIPDAPTALAAELKQMNIIIGMWKKSWVRARNIPQQRTLLSVQTKNWSDKVLKYSRMV